MSANNLNSEQEKAVCYDGLKPLLVEAGAGSGKTRVLTERVRKLIERGADPESILICTFSSKAAEELKNKLIDFTFEEDSIITKSDVSKMQISTIHSLCFDLVNNKGYSYEFYDGDFNEKKLMFISKHLKALGFEKGNYLTTRQVKKVADKFDEYVQFKFKEDVLNEYLDNERPISEEYKNLIENSYEGDKFVFPYETVKDSKELDEAWHNSRYHQISKALPIYQKLLTLNNATDFTYIQIIALEILSKDPETPYKHILVDEFQDTDPVQFKIFEILMNHALKDNVENKKNQALNDNVENDIKGTFTAVGDMNQNIYGFRGASFNFFKQLNTDYECITLPITTNHRSSNQIIDLSDDFISRNKDNECIKMDKFKNIDKDCYYMKSQDDKEEASKITELIKHLVSIDKANYEDILILFRSVIYHSDEIVESFNKNGIPYSIKGSSTIEEKDEIKSILVLLNYIVSKKSDVPSFSKNKRWLYSFKGFTGEFFNPIWNLSEETKAIINKIQDDYETCVLERGKIVQKELSAPNKRTFHTMFDHKNEVLEEIFKTIKQPDLSDKTLIDNGVNNEDDLEFFRQLNYLKEVVVLNPFECSETLLAIYYKLLDICGFLDIKFIENKENKSIISNLALISNTISNYQFMISEYNLSGLFNFLNGNLNNYKAPSHDDNGVQMMTVHEAKGLEYPITILAQVKKDRFPKSYVDSSKKHFNRNPYYTPNYCFEYKTLEEEKIKKHDEEEINIFYVAMTRAEENLIISTVENESEKIVYEMPEIVDDLIKKNPNILKELDTNNFKDIKPLIDHKKPPKEERLPLSYSIIDRYNSCPFSYKLKNDFGFMLDSNKFANYGNVVHASLEELNNLSKEDKSFTDEDIVIIVSKIHNEIIKGKIDIFEKQHVINTIIDYWNNIGKFIKVLETEYEFTLFEKDYILKGAIDLIFETEDGNLGIIDYKNVLEISDFKFERYEQQIHTYITALKEDSKYADKTVTEAYIHAIQAKEPNKVKVVDLKNFSFGEEKLKIEETLNNIKNENFEINPGFYCNWCTFNFICYKKRCIKCGKPVINDEDLCYYCQKDNS